MMMSYWKVQFNSIKNIYQMLRVVDVFQANVTPFVSLRCHILQEFVNIFLIFEKN